MTNQTKSYNKTPAMSYKEKGVFPQSGKGLEDALTTDLSDERVKYSKTNAKSNKLNKK